MTRLENWPRLLADYIESRRRTPFEWGANDCATFAAGGVEAITGACPFIDAHTHATALEARRVLRRLGCADVLTWASLALGTPHPNPLTARRGDVVGFEGSHGPTLGLCIGGVFTAPGPGGLAFLQLALADRTWRI